MSNELTVAQVIALRDHFIARQHELLALTCALVETESPSGDKAGSSEVALKYWRHFEGDASIVKRFSFRLNAKP